MVIHEIKLPQSSETEYALRYRVSDMEFALNKHMKEYVVKAICDKVIDDFLKRHGEQIIMSIDKDAIARQIQKDMAAKMWNALAKEKSDSAVM